MPSRRPPAAGTSASAQPPAPAPAPATVGGGRRRELVGKVLRYSGGSVVAGICSLVVFNLLFGVLDTSPALASVVGWLAGAVPNYWLNRSWTWRRRGRPSLTCEVLPYVAIVLATLALAAVATSAVDALLADTGTTGLARLAVVNGTFLAVYVVMFLLRYFMLDQLFRRLPAAPGLKGTDPRPTEQETT